MQFRRSSMLINRFSKKSQEHAMLQRDGAMMRRDFLAKMLAGTALLQTQLAQVRAQPQEAARDVFFERPADGTPHKGKVLLAAQAPSDDIPPSAARTGAQLVKGGYTGYLVPANHHDTGVAPGP